MYYSKNPAGAVLSLYADMQIRKRYWASWLLHSIVPTTRNGRHPHLFRTRPVVALVALLSVIQVGFFAYEFSFLRGGAQFAAVLPGAIAAHTNEARAEALATPLLLNEALSRAARKKANDMVAKNYFAHREPDGRMPWYRFHEEGYEYAYAGENLAVNFTDTKQLMDAWLASPKHRDNVLKPQYRDLGIGMATGTYKGRDAVFVVQLFGAERSDARFAIARENGTASATRTDERVLGAATSLSLRERIQASPRTFNARILGALFAVLGLFIVMTFVPRVRAHPRAVYAGFALFSAIIFFSIFQSNMWGSVEMPPDVNLVAATEL